MLELTVRDGAGRWRCGPACSMASRKAAPHDAPEYTTQCGAMSSWRRGQGCSKDAASSSLSPNLPFRHKAVPGHQPAFYHPLPHLPSAASSHHWHSSRALSRMKARTASAMSSMMLLVDLPRISMPLRPSSPTPPDDGTKASTTGFQQAPTPLPSQSEPQTTSSHPSGQEPTGSEECHCHGSCPWGLQSA